MYNDHMNSELELEYQVSEVADICGVSKETVRRWDRSGVLNSTREDSTGHRRYCKEQLLQFEEARLFFSNEKIEKVTKPKKQFNLIELFAGAGGLAIGLE